LTLILFYIYRILLCIDFQTGGANCPLFILKIKKGPFIMKMARRFGRLSAAMFAVIGLAAVLLSAGCGDRKILKS